MPLSKCDQKKISQPKQKMTPERLRSFKGFENYKTTEAEEVIKTLERFADIICAHVQNTN